MRQTKFVLTEHAINRYIERFEPGASKARATKTLKGLVRSAKRAQVVK